MLTILYYGIGLNPSGAFLALISQCIRTASQLEGQRLPEGQGWRGISGPRLLVSFCSVILMVALTSAAAMFLHLQPQSRQEEAKQHGRREELPPHQESKTLPAIIADFCSHLMDQG